MDQLFFKKYEKVFEIAQLSLKFLVLINGGAAVALLAFIGSVWSPYYSAPLTIIFLTIGLGAFALGVLSGVIAVLLAFILGAAGLSPDSNGYQDKFIVVMMTSITISVLLFIIGVGASITAILVRL